MEITEDIQVDLPIGHRLAMVSKWYFGALSKLLEKHDSERYFLVMSTIHLNKGNATQCLLGKALHVDKVSMTRIIDYLCDKGLAERSVNEDDRREKRIMLTEKGENGMHDIYKAFYHLENMAWTGIDEQERNSFLNCLEKMEKNLSGLPATTIFMNIETLK